MLLLSSADFFQNYLFQKNLSGILSESNSLALHFVGPDLEPNYLHIVKQQMTLAGKELSIF